MKSVAAVVRYRWQHWSLESLLHVPVFMHLKTGMPVQYKYLKYTVTVSMHFTTSDCVTNQSLGLKWVVHYAQAGRWFILHTSSGFTSTYFQSLTPLRGLTCLFSRCLLQESEVPWQVSFFELKALNLVVALAQLSSNLHSLTLLRSERSLQLHKLVVSLRIWLGAWGKKLLQLAYLACLYTAKPKA